MLTVLASTGDRPPEKKKMARPKRHPFPDYMTVDGDRGGFIVRNPITGKKKRFGPHEEALARQTAERLAAWVRKERERAKLFSGGETIAGLVERWKADRLPFMPWDTRTRQEALWKMDRIARELGDRLVKRTDCLFLEDWLNSFCRSTDSFNKWRYALVLLWRFAVSRRLAEANEAEKIEARSASKKLEINHKIRQPLDVDGFKAVHAAAPPFLQLAMELSLVTLQARTEVCNMRHDDFRDGYLFVIRDKVSGDSDMAFIKIVVTEQLEDIRRRARQLYGIASPFLVHRPPDRRSRQWTAGKPHWTYVKPEYLSKAFARARDATGLYGELEPLERPTFHEIRGLGARLYRASGMAEDAIRALMTHSHKRTTRIYLEGGREALSDDDFQPVTAPLRLADVLGGH